MPARLLCSLMSVAFAAPALQLRLDPARAIVGDLSQDSPASATPQTAPPATAAPEDVDLLPPEKAPDAATLEQQKEINDKIRRRRTMLQLHQLGGFATLASLTVAVTLGQLDYLDKYAGGGDSGRWITPHAIAAYSAAAIFTGTALLAVLAPNPTEKPLRLDTATLHKTAMSIAALGYATQIVLGILSARSEGAQVSPATRLRQRDFALAHQVVGYVTFAAAAGGFLVLTF